MVPGVEGPLTQRHPDACQALFEAAIKAGADCRRVCTTSSSIETAIGRWEPEALAEYVDERRERMRRRRFGARVAAKMNNEFGPEAVAVPGTGPPADE